AGPLDQHHRGRTGRSCGRGQQETQPGIHAPSLAKPSGAPARRRRSLPGMASYIKTVTWDCADALRVARFWAAALGTDVDEESTPDRAFVEAAGWGGPNMWFVRVPEAKTAKNRVHFDLRAPGPVADEVARLT